MMWEANAYVYVTVPGRALAFGHTTRVPAASCLIVLAGRSAELRAKKYVLQGGGCDRV
jgi:hypothetical protein